MISKELLSEVLHKDIYNNKILEFGYRNKSTIWVRTTMANDFVINIYELAHKYKEWAWSLNFDLQVKRHKNDAFYCVIDERNITFHKSKWGVNEQETIFKACQWIFDNKDK